MKNYNTAFATNYKFEITDAKEFNYFCQEMELPSVNAEGVETPYKGNNVVWQADRIDYDPLSLTFLIDEDFKNYTYLFNWMKMCTTRDIPLARQKDATLHILTGNKTKNLKVFFKGCFPTSLGSVPFESAVTDPTALTCSVNIKYQYFTIET